MRFLLLIPLFLFSSLSFGTDFDPELSYYWKDNSFGVGFKSSGAALSYSYSKYNFGDVCSETAGIFQGKPAINYKARDYNQMTTDYPCSGAYVAIQGRVHRESCPLGEVFNTETQSCEEPPPPQKCGRETRTFSYTLNSPNINAYCSFECQFDVLSSSSERYKDVFIVTGLAQNTGMECTHETVNVPPNEDLQECPKGMPDNVQCYAPTPHPDPETDDPSCGNGQLILGDNGSFCAIEDEYYDPDQIDVPDYPDPQPDTGGGDTGGGDTGGGDTGGGDTGGSLNCPFGFVENNGVCVSVPPEGGLSCPIGTSDVSGTCVPDDCSSGFYMEYLPNGSPIGCQQIPSLTPPTENTNLDSSGIIAAIKDQTFKINKNTVDTGKAGTLSIIKNDNKIAKDLSTQISSETDDLIGAINDGSGDIVTALGDVKSAIEGLEVSGGGGDGEVPPVDCGEGSELCPPDEEEEGLTGGVGGTVGTSYSSFGEVNQAFFDRVLLSEFGQAGANLPTMFEGSGTCPIFKIDFPEPINAIIQTDIHCTIWAQISGMLTAIMMIIYSFIGFRIIFEA